MRSSPFKFLDPYTREDKDKFFGRETEVDALYEYVNKNRLVLVYGPSGTGKTSVVQCGLAGRFYDTDWFPVMIRRKDDINAAFLKALAQANETETVETVRSALESLNAKLLRPIYLIFDQFEELLLLGSESEQRQFLQTIREVMETDIKANCHILFVLREEFLARLYSFEKELPALFNRRLRIEPMSHAKVGEVIAKSCSTFNISLENPERNIQQIIDNLSGGKSLVSLPYLQVYLDMLWREDYQATHPSASGSKDEGSGPYPDITFTTAEIEAMGKIEDVLARFLAEQEKNIQQSLSGKYKEKYQDKRLFDIDKVVNQVLDHFVSSEGTKQHLSCTFRENSVTFKEDAPEYLRNLPGNLLFDCLHALEQSRLLRITEDGAELAHDSLAAVIDKKRSDHQRRINDLRAKLENYYKDYEKRQDETELIPPNKLHQFKDDLSEILKGLDPGVKLFFKRSEEQAELLEKKKDRQIFLQQVLLVFAVLGIMLAIIFGRVAKEEAKESTLNDFAYKASRSLDKEDRTTAFRLAEFAYQYGGQNNNKVRQALFDAYYATLSPDSIRNRLPWSLNLTSPTAAFFQTAWSPDGKYLATISDDGNGHIWEVASGRQISTLPEDTSGFAQIAWAQKGNRLALRNEKGMVITFQTQPSGKLTSEDALIANCDYMAWSPDGSYCLTIKETAGKLWSVGQTTSSDNLNWPAGFLSGSFSPDGGRIAMGGIGGTLLLFDLKSRQQLSAIKGISDVGISKIVWSSDSRYLATLSEQSVQIWAMNDYAPEHLLDWPSQQDVIRDIVWLPDKPILAVALDEVVVLWNTQSGERLMDLNGHEGNINNLSCSANGRYLASASMDKTVKIWDMRSARFDLGAPESSNDVITALCWTSPDTLLEMGLSDTIWRIMPGPKSYFKQIELLAGADYRAWSPDGGKVAAVSSGDSTIKIMDIRRNDTQTIQAEAGVGQVFWSADNQHLAAAATDILRIWNIDEPKKSLTIKAFPGSSISAASWSSLDQLLAAGDYLGQVGVWDGRSGKRLWTIQEHKGAVQSISWSPDGGHVATAAADNTVKIWKAGNGRLLFTLQESANAIAWSPDNQYLAVACNDGKVLIWGVKQEAHWLTLYGHGASVQQVCWSPGGDQLASLGLDNTIRRWHMTPDTLLDQYKKERPLLILTSDQIEKYELDNIAPFVKKFRDKLQKDENTSQYANWEQYFEKQSKGSSHRRGAWSTIRRFLGGSK